MERIPKELTPRDVAQWLQGGWFVYNGAPHSFVENGGGVVSCTDLAGNNKVIQAVDCYIHWPLCGSVNLPDGYAAYVNRRPAKAYTRTYTAALVDVSIPNRWEVLAFLSALKRPLLDIQRATLLDGNDRKLVDALFSPKYPNTAAAVELMETSRAISVAISRTLIMVYQRAEENFAVMYRGKQVGIFTGDNLVNSDLDEITDMRVRKTLGIM